MTLWDWRTRSAVASLLALGCVCADTGSRAAPAKDGQTRSCFRNQDVSDWTDVDHQTINIRVNVNDYYQLKLLSPCGNIDFSQRIGIRTTGGSDYICSGLDAEIIAPTTIGPQTCPVTSIRKLTPEDVAALPKGQKP
jgi:hypothetical protein